MIIGCQVTDLKPQDKGHLFQKILLLPWGGHMSSNSGSGMRAFDCCIAPAFTAAANAESTCKANGNYCYNNNNPQ